MARWTREIPLGKMEALSKERVFPPNKKSVEGIGDRKVESVVGWSVG
jgi:hypothetical protein